MAPKSYTPMVKAPDPVAVIAATAAMRGCAAPSPRTDIDRIAARLAAQQERLAQTQALMASFSKAAHRPAPPPRPSTIGNPDARLRANTLSMRPQVPRKHRDLFTYILVQNLDTMSTPAQRSAYAEGLQALWPTYFQPTPRVLAPNVAEAVTETQRAVVSHPSWNVCQQLRFYSTLCRMNAMARSRARLLLGELALACPFAGTMTDLEALSESGPAAGAYLDQRRRMIRFADKTDLEAFAKSTGEDRKALLSSFGPLQNRPDPVAEDTSGHDPTRPSIPSALHEVSFA